MAHNALVPVKPSVATTNSTRVDNSRDMIPHIGTITTSAIRYAVCTQAISSALADSPPWIWLSELVTICTSIMAMNKPTPIARIPIQSRRRGSGLPRSLPVGRVRPARLALPQPVRGPPPGNGRVDRVEVFRRASLLSRCGGSRPRHTDHVVSGQGS